jgi:hypothetical protein
MDQPAALLGQNLSHYEVLTGRKAFQGDSTVSTLTAELAIGLVVAVVGWCRSTQPVSQPLVRLSVELGPEFRATGDGTSAILSPDGRRVVYRGQGADGKFRLYTRMLS